MYTIYILWGEKKDLAAAGFTSRSVDRGERVLGHGGQTAVWLCFRCGQVSLKHTGATSSPSGTCFTLLDKPVTSFYRRGGGQLVESMAAKYK